MTLFFLLLVLFRNTCKPPRSSNYKQKNDGHIKFHFLSICFSIKNAHVVLMWRA